jgi:hypothetical protein
LVRKAGPLAALLIGALLITVIQLVPLLGFLAFLVFMLLALGSAALSGYGTSTDWLSRRLSAQPPVRPAPPAAPQ